MTRTGAVPAAAVAAGLAAGAAWAGPPAAKAVVARANTDERTTAVAMGRVMRQLLKMSSILCHGVGSLPAAGATGYDQSSRRGPPTSGSCRRVGAAPGCGRPESACALPPAPLGAHARRASAAASPARQPSSVVRPVVTRPRVNDPTWVVSSGEPEMPDGSLPRPTGASPVVHDPLLRSRTAPRRRFALLAVVLLLWAAGPVSKAQQAPPGQSQPQGSQPARAPRLHRREPARPGQARPGRRPRRASPGRGPGGHAGAAGAAGLPHRHQLRPRRRHRHRQAGQPGDGPRRRRTST